LNQRLKPIHLNILNMYFGFAVLFWYISVKQCIFFKNFKIVKNVKVLKNVS